MHVCNTPDNNTIILKSPKSSQRCLQQLSTVSKQAIALATETVRHKLPIKKPALPPCFPINIEDNQFFSPRDPLALNREIDDRLENKCDNNGSWKQEAHLWQRKYNEERKLRTASRTATLRLQELLAQEKVISELQQSKAFSHQNAKYDQMFLQQNVSGVIPTVSSGTTACASSPSRNGQTKLGYTVSGSSAARITFGSSQDSGDESSSRGDRFSPTPMRQNSGRRVSCEQTNDALLEEKRTLVERIDQLACEKTQLSRQMDCLRQDNVELQQRLLLQDDQESKQRESELALQELEVDMIELKAQLEVAKREAADALACCAEDSANLQEILAWNETLQSQLDAMESEKLELMELLRQAERERDECREDVSRLTTALCRSDDQGKKEFDRHEMENGVMVEKCEKLESDLAAADQMVADLTLEYDVLTEEKENERSRFVDGEGQAIRLLRKLGKLLCIEEDDEHIESMILKIHQRIESMIDEWNVTRKSMEEGIASLKLTSVGSLEELESDLSRAQVALEFETRKRSALEKRLERLQQKKEAPTSKLLTVRAKSSRQTPKAESETPPASPQIAQKQTRSRTSKQSVDVIVEIEGSDDPPPTSGCKTRGRRKK